MNASPSNHARLIPQPTEAEGTPPAPVVIEHTPFTLGRGSDQDFRLTDPHASRAHAVLDRDSGGYLVSDAGSRHGTFVNGRQITSARLHAGDRIAFGTPDQAFVFEDLPQIAEQPRGSETRSILLQLTQARMARPDAPEGHDGAEPGSQSSVQASAKADLTTLTLFLQAAQSLNQRGALNDVLRTMLEYTLRLTGAERGFVYLGDAPETFHLASAQTWDPVTLTGGPADAELLAQAHLSEAHPEFSGVSPAIIRDAIGSGLDFFLTNVSGETEPGRHTLILNAIRSVAAIPLRGQNSGRLLGLLYLDSRHSTHDFTRTSKDILAVIAHQAATLLENIRMLEAEREAVLLRKELEIAAAIQLQIIPQHLPVFPFARLAARTLPCTGVGGDFYDALPVPNGFVAIVGDVCGKGIPAALLASTVQGMVHAQIATGASLVDTIQSINTFICTRAPGEKYVTLAILRYIQPADPDLPAEVELINGGHISPLVVRANGTVETIADGDLPVGLLDFATFHTIRITLAVGDRIVLLSDGITEAEDLCGTQFGPTEMAPYLTLPDPVSALFAAIGRFCNGAHPLDDQTVLTLDRTA